MQKTKLNQEQRQLLVLLSVDERLAAGMELAMAVDRLASFEEEEKAVRTGLRERRDAKEKEVLELRTLVLRGSRPGMADVTTWAFHDEGKVRTIRDDTGQCVEERAMAPEEYQLPIDFVGRPEPPPGEAA